MNRFLPVGVFFLSMLGMMASGALRAQEAVAVVPVTYDQVIVGCSCAAGSGSLDSGSLTAGNTEGCLNLVDQYVLQVLANGEPSDVQTQTLNDLVYALANSAIADETIDDCDMFIAQAIERIAIDAPDTVNVAAINGIADSVRSGDYVATAATAPSASPQ